MVYNVVFTRFYNAIIAWVWRGYGVSITLCYVWLRPVTFYLRFYTFLLRFCVSLWALASFHGMVRYLPCFFCRDVSSLLFTLLYVLITLLVLLLSCFFRASFVCSYRILSPCVVTFIVAFTHFLTLLYVISCTWPSKIYRYKSCTYRFMYVIYADSACVGSSVMV